MNVLIVDFCRYQTRAFLQLMFWLLVFCRYQTRKFLQFMFWLLVHNLSQTRISLTLMFWLLVICFRQEHLCSWCSNCWYIICFRQEYLCSVCSDCWYSVPDKNISASVDVLIVDCSVSDDIHRELWESSAHKQQSGEAALLQPHRVRVPGPYGGSDAERWSRNRNEDRSHVWTWVSDHRP